MKQHIALVTLIVDDYEKALEFYTKKLQFDLIEDTTLSDDKRWVVVAPKGSTETALLLAKASNEDQESRIGNQTGGRVAFFLYTDSIWEDYKRMLLEGIIFLRPPVTEIYGTVAVFQDPYGNKWDIIEPTQHSK